MNEQVSTEVAKEVAKSIGPVAKTVSENAAAAAKSASAATEGLGGELLKRAYEIQIEEGITDKEILKKRIFDIQ